MTTVRSGNASSDPRCVSALTGLLCLVGLLTGPTAQADEGGPDEYGYIWIDSNNVGGPTYAPDFTPQSSPANPLELGDDTAVTVSIGFPFQFYGETYTEMLVHSNGGITFGNDPSPLAASFWFRGSPNVSQGVSRNCNELTWPAPTIAGYWSDLNPALSSGLDGDGGVYSSLFGVSGSRRHVVAWYQIPHFNSQGKNQFEIKLFEEDSHIEFHYVTLAGGTSFGGGRSSAIGTGGSDHELLRSCGDDTIINHTALSISQLPCDDLDLDGACAWEDCDNEDAAVYPSADEICNDVDDNCDGQIDESGAIGERTWYRDLDGDGHGAAGPSVTVQACHQPDGYAENNDDCDDGDNDTFPGAPEQCDGQDNDCDPSTIEDADSDGDDSTPCDPVPDCDDSDATLNPHDRDEDGISSCAGDCNDSVAAIRPGAAEICDGYDNDCDNRVDENPNCQDATPPGYDIPYGCILACDLAEPKSAASDRAALVLVIGLLVTFGSTRRRRRGPR